MASPDTKRSTILWLGFFLLLALTLRIAFNVGDSFDDDAQRYLYSGNDPYYHDRTVNHILDEGEHLMHDPAINYPIGAMNPNPPIYDWVTVPLAAGLQAAGVTDAVGLALNIMVAVWGAITVIPIYVVGRDLFGRRAGLWAAFFMAVSAPHIERSVFGFADHDATTVFWLALTMAFMVKALQAMQRREYISDWRRPDAWSSGFSLAWNENRTAFAWSILAGLAVSAMALTWKGYPYVLAILAVALAFQLLQDHLKNRDSTPVWLIYLIPLAMVVLLPYLLYYRATPFVGTTIMPSIYVLLGALVAGAILVPTRDLPSILVFPALLVAGVLGLVLLLFVFPATGNVIFSGLGYFEQSKLYTTIAEAQRTPLGRIAASFGFFSFLLAFYGLYLALKHAFRHQASHLLVAAWAAVSIFMAFAALRFVTNAAPVFAVLMGGATARIVAWAGFDQVRQRYRRAHGRGAAGMVGSITLRSTLATLMIVVLLVLPNLWIGADAGTSFGYDVERGWLTGDQERDRMGAFGVSFDVDDNGWLPLMLHLSRLDQDLPIGERPAFIAWWDYGHWATDIGKHPTVADPFQNHYGQAGRFLASEEEHVAVGWLSILLLDHARAEGGQLRSEAEGILSSYDPRLVPLVGALPLDEKMDVFRNVTDDDPDMAFDLYEDLMDATGKRIHYFGVDVRMWPQSADSPGIFYAPAYLANKNPDEFVRTSYRTQTGQVLVQKAYDFNAQGDSYALREPVYIDQQSQVEYVIVAGQAWPKGQVPLGAEQGQATGGLAITPPAVLQPQPRFFDTMYTRAFGGVDADATNPGDGLSHWRAVFEDTFDAQGGRTGRNTVLLEYFRGVVASGSVQDDTGAAFTNATVTFADGFGARHATATTDSEGRFEVVAPFGDDLTLQVLMDGVVVAEQSGIGFDRGQAEREESVDGFDLTVRRGSVEGFVFEDADADNAYNATVDTAITGATVTVGGTTATTGDEGRYTLSGVLPGRQDLRITAAGYEPRTGTIAVASGEMTWGNRSLTLSPANVTLRVTAEGQPLDEASITIDGLQQAVVTDADGNATATLAPGTYNATVRKTMQEDGAEVLYTASHQFVVPRQTERVTVSIQAERQV